MEGPIMGPPSRTFSASSVNPPHCSIRSDSSIPTGTRKLPGLLMPAPVRVTMRSVQGRFSVQAQAMAEAVPAFTTTTPTSRGRPPVGTMRLRIARMSCRSPPWGYLVLQAATCKFGILLILSAIRSMASFLLSSMAMRPRSAPAALMASCKPAIMGPGASSIRR